MPYEKTHRREVVRLHEALTSRGTAPSMIANVEFDDCDLYGPVVLGFLQDVAVEDCEFDAPPEHMFIEAAPDRAYTGIIGLQNVRMYGCRFHNIGMLGPPELFERFRQAVTGVDEPRSS